ncbi:unnamed protein product, partial [Boreogadus saida]
MITTSMGMWREQLAVTPETGVQVPARTANKKLRYLNGFILFLYHVNGKVKYNLQNILFCVLVVWRCRFESPHARLIRREYPPGCKSVLVVMRSVVWVSTLQVQVRVPARKANKKL